MIARFLRWVGILPPVRGRYTTDSVYRRRQWQRYTEDHTR